jgi:hypothetical protein
LKECRRTHEASLKKEACSWRELSVLVGRESCCVVLVVVLDVVVLDIVVTVKEAKKKEKPRGEW